MYLLTSLLPYASTAKAETHVDAQVDKPLGRPSYHSTNIDYVV